MKVVTKNFDRVTTPYADYLYKRNLYIYTHEINLHRKIIAIYTERKARKTS